MTWKPKERFSCENQGHCPSCGAVIEAGQFFGEHLTVKSSEEPLDIGEANFHCDECDTDLFIDLELKLYIRSFVVRSDT